MSEIKAPASPAPLDPKASTPRRRLSPQDRKEDLLDQAVIAYARLGVERAGHGDVAKSSGVSTATVFNYFPTRKDLTRSVLDKVEAEIMTIFNQESAAHAGSARARLSALAFQFIELLDRQPDIIKVMLNWSVSFGEAVRPEYLEFQSRILRHLQPVLEDRSEDLTDCRILYGASFTYSTLKLDQTAPETLNAFVKRVVEMITLP